jgi:hypothetical protein
MWYLKPSQKSARVTGYLTVQKAGQSDQMSEDFVVAPGSRSLAAERGFTDRLGQVTAVVFDFVPTGGKSLPSIGTAAGKKKKTEIADWGYGKRGTVLAAMTVRYVTPAELDQIVSRGAGQTDSSGSSSGSGTDQARTDKPADDESVPFPRGQTARAEKPKPDSDKRDYEEEEPKPESAEDSKEKPDSEEKPADEGDTDKPADDKPQGESDADSEEDTDPEPE